MCIVTEISEISHIFFFPVQPRRICPSIKYTAIHIFHIVCVFFFFQKKKPVENGLSVMVCYQLLFVICPLTAAMCSIFSLPSSVYGFGNFSDACECKKYTSYSRAHRKKTRRKEIFLCTLIKRRARARVKTSE